MARLSKEKWEDLEADYHTGQYSKNELAERYEVSHTAVNKRLKGVEPKHKEKVSTLIATKSSLYEESFNFPKEVSAVETLVEEKLQHINFFKNSALRNQEQANRIKDKIINDTETKDGQKLYSLGSHANITKVNKEIVVGKEIDTQVNIQNNVNTLEWDLVSNG